MTVNPKNVVVLTGGVVADPERPTANIAKFRVAADYSGREDNSDNRSGYFDVVFWLNDDNPNVKFVKRQLDDGNLKKGSQVQITGSLAQRRWKTEEGQNRSNVEIVADAITYAGGSRREDDSSGETSKSATSATIEVPDEF